MKAKAVGQYKRVDSIPVAHWTVHLPPVGVGVVQPVWLELGVKALQEQQVAAHSAAVTQVRPALAVLTSMLYDRQPVARLKAVHV